MQKLVFFFPWREVSGGPFYLVRLADGIAKRDKYDVYYTDYPDGLCDSLLHEKSVKVLRYHDETHFEIFIEEPIILVMAEYWAHVVPQVHPDTKILFFNWHNECIPVLKRDWCASDVFIEKFINLVKETSSVFFCDKTHWMAHERYGIDVSERYVPVVIPPRNKKAKEELVREGVRNIAILGRLCQDKIYAVLDLMDNIIALRDRVKTNVYIIGEGDHEELLFKRKFPDSIKIIRCGTMEIKAVISLLSKKVDILFAMGTSVLEGATIRLPAVVIPNDMNPFRCNHYPYLYESKGYALGWYPEQIEELNMYTHTIEDIFNDIYVERRKAEIGERCYEYYYNNHRDNVNQFVEAIQATSLTYNRYLEFKHKNINWRNLFWQVKHKFRRFFGYTYKRFSLFGLPIYIRTKTNEMHSNIYICCIPTFRINKINNTIGIYILPLVWIWRIVQNIVEKIAEKIKNLEVVRRIKRFIA